MHKDSSRAPRNGVLVTSISAHDSTAHHHRCNHHRPSPLHVDPPHSPTHSVHADCSPSSSLSVSPFHSSRHVLAPSTTAAHRCHLRRHHRRGHRFCLAPPLPPPVPCRRAAVLRCGRLLRCSFSSWSRTRAHRSLSRTQAVRPPRPPRPLEALRTVRRPPLSPPPTPSTPPTASPRLPRTCWGSAGPLPPARRLPRPRGGCCRPANGPHW